MKYIDENGLLYLIQKIKTWDNGKVDAVQGKGLSTNDFDATYKNALDNLATNYVAAVSGKGLSTNDYDNTEKAKVAAAQTASDVTTAIESYGYQTSSQVASAIATALAGFSGVSFSIVDTLPQSGTAGVFYLVPNSGSGTNGYDEYIWVTIPGAQEGDPSTTRFEKIGTTDIDLSGYVQSSSLSAITNGEIDTIIASANS